MIRIQSIYIENFKGKDSVYLEFPNSQVTIIYGSNGCGKTTLLKVINAMLSFNESNLAYEEITYVRLSFYDTKKLLNYNLFCRFNNEEGKYEWSIDDTFIKENSRIYSSILFGVNRGTAIPNDVRVMPGDISRFIHLDDARIINNSDTLSSSIEYLERFADFLNHNIRNRRKRRGKLDFDLEDKHLQLDNLSMDNIELILTQRYSQERRFITERVQKALFETMATVLEKESLNKKNIKETIPSTFIQKLKKYYKTLLDILNSMEENEVCNKIIFNLQKFLYEDNDEELLYQTFLESGLLANLVFNMIDELEKGEGVLNSVNQLIDEYNTYLSDGKSLVVDYFRVYVKTNNGNHDLAQLSSGERHLLSLLTLFMIEGKKRDFLLIDEPEISLNITWQSKLLKLFTEFAPNSQIIVATHSPAIAEYNTNALVEI